MSSVNSSNNKSYIGWSALAGGLGGAAIGYNLKTSYLEEPGRFTDEFRQSVKNVMNKDLKSGSPVVLSKDAIDASTQVGKYKNVDDVVKYLRNNNKFVKKLESTVDYSVTDGFLSRVKKKGFDSALNWLKYLLKRSDYINTTAKVFKLKTALQFGVYGTLVGAVSAFLLNKIKA